MFEIQIGDKVIKCFFGMHVFEELAKYATEGGDMGQFGFLSILIQSAHENYCKSERPALPFQTNYGDVRRHVEMMATDEAFAQRLVEVMAIYNESTPKKLIDKVNEQAEPVKKKKVVPIGKK
jgi:hypothetical protein